MNKENLILLRIETQLKPLEKELIYLQGQESYYRLKEYFFEVEKTQGKIHGYKVAISNLKEIEKTVKDLFKI
jgi:hypothetical protein